MRLLIVGPFNRHMSVAARLALKKGIAVGTAETVEESLQVLRAGRGTDLIFLDAHCSVSGLIQNLQAERINIPVVAYGGKEETALAVRAIQAGAKEYIPLPPDPVFISDILESVAFKEQTFVAKDPSFIKVLKLAKRVAASEANVLITGESGTGKEILARYIQRESSRATCPFITINCAAIPETLLESELFGHEKGAFTGAVARRIGKFEEADTGTLLLDEISEMHPFLQGKLLRAIQEHEICRIGGNQNVKINIRLIATSNRDLAVEVQEGHFREDLFYRLNVISLKIPPLRERQKDILPLAEFFAQKYCRLNELETKVFTESARTQLKKYSWPGNVREMENLIHRTVLLSDDAVIAQIDALSEKYTANTASSIFLDPSVNLVGQTIPELEKSLIIETLHQCLGNKTQAARTLGISIRTLRNKLHAYAQDEHEEIPQKEVACL